MSEVLKALDNAIDNVERWLEEDDRDSSTVEDVHERVERLRVLAPTPVAKSHFPVDTLTGKRTDPKTLVTDVGPVSPRTAGE